MQYPVRMIASAVGSKKGVLWMQWRRLYLRHLGAIVRKREPLTHLLQVTYVCRSSLAQMVNTGFQQHTEHVPVRRSSNP